MRRDLREDFERGRTGMMEVPVALDVLIQTREEFVAEIVGRMPDPHSEFLRSIAGGKPKWSLLEVPDVSSLPRGRVADEKARTARREGAIGDGPEDTENNIMRCWLARLPLGRPAPKRKCAVHRCSPDIRSWRVELL